MIGFAGFESIENQRTWSSASILLVTMVTDIISNALMRRKIEMELRQSESRNRALLDAVPEAAAQMREIYGTEDIAWGDMIKVGRGGKLFPCSGADYGNGENESRLRTLLSVGVKESGTGKGVYVAHKGSGDFILMFMHKDGIESYTCTPWGQSADPNSPHYMDQGEQLFSQRKFKPVHRSREALLNYVTSSKTLAR